MSEQRWTIYACPECSYRSLTPGPCLSHPYPLRGMGPETQPVEVVPVSVLQQKREGFVRAVERLNEQKDRLRSERDDYRALVGADVADDLRAAERERDRLADALEQTQTRVNSARSGACRCAALDSADRIARAALARFHGEVPEDGAAGPGAEYERDAER